VLGPRPLSPQQQQAVERVARELGVRCLRCGSPELQSEDMAVLTHNYVNVMLICPGPKPEHSGNVAAIDKSYPFGYEDAARFGIRRPPDPPPRRYPGETAPRS
jgi:hypothetical protein